MLELQNCVSSLQDQLSQVHESDLGTSKSKDKDVAARSQWKQVSHDEQLQIELCLYFELLMFIVEVKSYLSAKLFFIYFSTFSK